MSVEANTVAYAYAGNGITTAFAFPSRFLSGDHIIVGVDGALQVGGYAVSGAGLDGGGTVTFTSPPAAGAEIVLVRAPPISQLQDFVAAQTILETTLDNGLDKLTMVAQHLARAAGRTLRVSDFAPDPQPNLQLPGAQERANKYLRFGALGEVALIDPAAALTLTTRVAFPSRAAAEAANVDPTTNLLWLEGYATPGDGGQGATYARLAAAPIPVEPWHLNSADGAWFVLSAASPTVGMFGGIGGPDDTAAFAALEEFAPGRIVDLGGRSYNVSAQPRGCAYENGAFVVAGTPAQLRARVKSHPFEDATSTIVRHDFATHIWPGAITYLDAIDTLALTWVESNKHDIGSPSAVRFAYAQNGVDLRDTEVMFSRTDRSVQASQGGKGSGGRLIYVHSCFDPTAGNAPKTVISYTDTNGGPFTSFDAVLPNQWSLGYGPALDDPVAGKLHMFGYGPGAQIVHAWTVANGASLNSSVALAAVGTLVEPWVVRLDANRAFMFLRDDAGGAVYVSLSSDNLATWSAPVSTGITGGANPLSALVRDGRVYLYVYARRGAEIYGRSDVQLVWSTPAEPLWAAGGVFPNAHRAPIVNLSAKTNILGYDAFAETRSGLVRMFVAGEDATGSANGSSAQLVLQTTERPTLAAPAVITQMRPRPNELHNGCLMHSQRGDAFNSAAPFKWADRWAASPNGGGALVVARSSIPANFGLLFPHRPRSAWLFSGGGIAPSKSIYQRHNDLDKICRLADRMITLQMWGVGDMPSPAACVVTVDPDNGGPPLTTATAVFKSRVQQYGMWHMQASLASYSLAGVSLGANAVLNAVFRFEPGAVMGGYLTGLKLEPGDASPLEPGPYDELEFLRQFYEKLDYPAGAAFGAAMGSGGAAVEIHGVGFGRKRVAPAITVSNAAALSVTRPGAGATATTGLQLDLTSLRSARATAVLAAGTLAAGDTGPAYCAAPLTLNIDADLSV